MTQTGPWERMCRLARRQVTARAVREELDWTESFLSEAKRLAAASQYEQASAHLDHAEESLRVVRALLQQEQGGER